MINSGLILLVYGTFTKLRIGCSLACWRPRVGSQFEGREQQWSEGLSLPPGDLSSINATSTSTPSLPSASHIMSHSLPPTPKSPTPYRGGQQAWKTSGSFRDHIASEWQAWGYSRHCHLALGDSPLLSPQHPQCKNLAVSLEEAETDLPLCIYFLLGYYL